MGSYVQNHHGQSSWRDNNLKAYSWNKSPTYHKDRWSSKSGGSNKFRGGAWEFTTTSSPSCRENWRENLIIIHIVEEDISLSIDVRNTSMWEPSTNTRPSREFHRSAISWSDASHKIRDQYFKVIERCVWNSHALSITAIVSLHLLPIIPEPAALMLSWPYSRIFSRTMYCRL